MAKSKGDFFAICEKCDHRFYRSKMDHDGYGHLVDKGCFDALHPQERTYVASPREMQVDDPNPEGAERFLGPQEITEDDF